MIQVIHGNTALTHISLFSGRSFTATAYCQARRFLPLAVFQTVLRNLLKGLVPDTQTQGLWRGHRTWLVDGSSFSMPDTPELQAKFGQPGNQSPGCGFPVAKILALFHAGTGLLLDVVAAPLRTHDMSQVGGIHPTLQADDIMVVDRGLSSYAHVAMLSQRLVHAVFRMHQRQIVDFTPGRPHFHLGEKNTQKGLPRSRWLRGLGVLDQVVEWFKPVDAPEWMTAEEYAALPDTLVVRELRYDVGRPGFRTKSVTLVTTLLDAELYPLEALAELYGMRWRVELNLRHLKQTMKMDVLKCATVEGVLKELAAYAIVYNLVCLVMMEAAKRQKVAVERISFIDALRWLLQAKPGDELPELIVNPDRPDRVEPRVKKRRPKQYPLMKKPRAELRNNLMGQGVNA
ncbi:IS4 family transposase [Singulisphaera sp. Ch08]|uniref:IS4 family transposase n=1 Tax=Singulisphaera sp. Ch08 TaxID=3120278 RepID=A0AAU7CJ91_9BACT